MVLTSMFVFVDSVSPAGGPSLRPELGRILDGNRRHSLAVHRVYANAGLGSVGGCVQFLHKYFRFLWNLRLEHA